MDDSGLDNYTRAMLQRAGNNEPGVHEGRNIMGSPGDETQTGHIVGARYESDYWGYEYKVVGEVRSPLGEPHRDVVVRKYREGGSYLDSHRTSVGDDERID